MFVLGIVFAWKQQELPVCKREQPTLPSKCASGLLGSLRCCALRLGIS